MVKKKRYPKNTNNTSLPPVLPVEVIDINDEGDLICAPTGKEKSRKPLPQIYIRAEHAQTQKPPPGIRDRLLIRLQSTSKSKSLEATIIRKINREHTRLLAVFESTQSGGYASPVERNKRDDFYIPKKDAGSAKDGDIVWIETQSHSRRGSDRKKARITGIAGNMDAPGAYSLIALAGHDIPIEFPSEVIEDAKAAKLPTMRGRTDLRKINLITIDPADAKDHDDAVAAFPDDDPANEGGYKVWVAIADVSWFVRPGSALDREALQRGNSVYLPDRVVPMLPEALSNDLCSLRPHEDRPCLAVEMILDKDGHLRGHRFVRAMMHSAAKLSYEDAQAIIDGNMPDKDRPDDEIITTIRDLYAAYECRLKERKKRSPLDLELHERKIILGDDGLVDKVIARERFDAHKLIEEFMIMANVAAAETLERARLPLIYRVHDAPDPEKLNAVRDYLATLDYSLVKGKSIRPSHFNQVLRLAAKRDQKEMVSEVVLRTQQQAIYSTENVGHFGLHLARYAHFTSPIRRYADLTVHRALVKACELGTGGQTHNEAEELEAIAEEISTLERRAMLAERETSDRYLADYLSDRVGAEFDARIRGATRFGLFVMLDESGADGFIPMRNLPGRGWRHDETLNRITDGRTGNFYQLGTPVRVRLKEAAPIEGGLIFEITSKPQHPKKAKPTGRVGQAPRSGKKRKKR